MHNRVPTITTERLVLRALRLSDAQDVFAYSSDPDVAQHTHWQPHTTFNQAYATTYRNSQDTLIWGIEHKKYNKVIGECGFARMQDTSAELYYALAKDHWGDGLATEAATALVAFAFESLNVYSIEAWIIEDNQASVRVAKKIGMACQAVFEQQWYAASRMHDLHHYVLHK